MARRARSLMPRGGYGWSLLIVVIAGAILRFWHLSTLPPGLATGEATIGLSAYHLSHNGIWPTFSAASGQSPLLVTLEAGAQLMFGLAPWVLRIIPALIGTAAIITTFLWARLWFGRRTGLIAAVLLATAPWSISLSRSIEPAALVPFLLSLVLWLGTRLWHHHRTRELVLLAVCVIATSFAGPAGWAVLGVLAATGVTLVVRPERKLRPALTVSWTVIGLLTILPALFFALQHKPNLYLVQTVSALFHSVSHVLLAFLVHGDDSYLINLGGQPLLNVFIGITAVAGILVSATRFKRQPDRILLVTFVVALIPAMITAGDSPSASRLGLAMVPVLTLSAIGIGYMLEVWYTTFPINSAARITGQGAILILMALSAYQGYTQYFVAWAASSATYSTYNEAAIGVSTWAKAQPKTSNLVLVIAPEEASAITYSLLGDAHYYTLVTSRDAVAPAVTVRPLTLAATADFRDNLVTALKAKAPGGTIQAHASTFDQHELFYTYAIH